MEKPKDMPWVVTFHPGDSLEEKLGKAARVKPSPAQLAWMEKEYIAFVHFGPNTFTGRQWGNGTESVSVFAPEALHVEQWCGVCAQAGMKMIVFTAKHHDGFCLWHTRTTDFSIQNSPARQDILAALSAGCRENNLELGVYLSPWDMRQRENGLWGSPQYNDYFLEQLDELLTRYGDISEVWLDGACSDYPIWQAVPSYRPGQWYARIEEKHPNAVIRLYDPYFFAGEEEWRRIQDGRSLLRWSGKGVRWVGNEGGISRADEWSVQPVFARQIAENATWSDLGEEKYYENAVGAIWYPLEVNTVVQNQWFWNEKTSVTRSLSDLVEVYYSSIGNNGVLLLNVSPNTQGIIGEDQIERLMRLKKYADTTFCNNLASGATVTASEGESCCNHVLGDDPMAFWTPGEPWDIHRDTASLIFHLDSDKTFDNVMVREFIREGQRVAEWSLDIWTGDAWREVVRHKTIGYKSIKRFDSVTTAKVRLNILRSWDSPMISAFGLYASDALPEEKTSASEVVSILPPAMAPVDPQPGLTYDYYDRGLQSAALLDSVFAVKRLETGIAPKADTSRAQSAIGYSLVFSGFLRVPEEGEYDFHLESADGSLLFLGDMLLLHNDEPHELKTVSRKAILQKGYYPVKILYTSFRHNGSLRLYWSGPSLAPQEIDPEFYFFPHP